MSNKQKVSISLIILLVCFFAKTNSVSAKEFLGRGLVCMPKAPGVYCSWRLLPIDDAQTGFNIYRSSSLAGTFIKINGAAIMTSTNYHDTGVTSGTYYYQIRPVKNNIEGERSELMKATAGGTKNYIDIYKKNPDKESIQVIPGDLNGDGVIDFLVISPSDTGTCDLNSPNLHTTYMMEGIIHKDGEWKSNWTFDTKYEGCGGYLVVTIWDLDGDGKSEIIGEFGKDYLVNELMVMNGETGRILARHPHARHPQQNTGMGHTVAHLKDMNGDGITDPFIVTSHGTYFNAHRFAAYYFNGSSLERVDDLTLTGASTVSRQGRTSHGFPAADLDLDGKDELLACGLVLDDDFSVKFEANLYHNDACYPGDIDLGRPGLETFMGTERGLIAHLLDKDGIELWRKTVRQNYDGWERGWCAELTTAYPGLECFVYEKNEDAKEGTDEYYGHVRIFAANGKDIASELLTINLHSFEAERQAPIDWYGGDGVKELYYHGNPTGPNGIPANSASWYGAFLADVLGDSREEVGTAYPQTGIKGYVRIFINNELNTNRYVTPLADRDYRASVSRIGVGYREHYIGSKSGQQRTDAVYTSGVPQRCASFGYAPEACQPNRTQKLNIVSVSPLGCAGGTPVLSQSCTYVPPICNEVDEKGTYFEAEHFTGSLAGKDGILFESAQTGYLGEGYLKTVADGSTGSIGEAKEYELYFSKAGTYKVWMRGMGFGDTSDSVHFGINGEIKGDLFISNLNEWKWIGTSHPQYGIGDTFIINQPGIYKFNIFIREIGFLIDAVYLTQGAEVPSDISHNIESNPTSCGKNPADVNSDNKVNIKDIQIVIRVIIGTESNARADVNEDGRVNIKDIQEIIREIIKT